jgi:hypothetical protein
MIVFIDAIDPGLALVDQILACLPATIPHGDKDIPKETIVQVSSRRP